MNKLGLIINREYLTRVKNKNFILTTLLVPLGVLLFMIVVTFIFRYKSDRKYDIAVLDQSQSNFQIKSDNPKVHFIPTTESMETLKNQYKDGKINAILVFPKFAGADVKNYTAYYYSDKSMDIELESDLSQSLSSIISDYKLKALSLEKSVLDKLDTEISIDPEPISENGKNQSADTSKIATALGGIMGYIIWFVIFLYGASVMRSVTEEKVNRIVEVVISSVHPTTLMLGKIIAVGLVGLTQLFIWFVLISGISVLGSYFIEVSPEQLQQAASSMPKQNMAMQENIISIMHELFNLNWWKIIPLFMIYFLGGYFVYSAMFAAIGAAVGDDINDSQSLTIFVTIPILFAMYIMFQAIREPFSNLAIFASIFPLFSPIVMPAMLAFDPPAWQLAVSIICLFLFAYFVIFVAGKIYRTGILLYGKKASIKEIVKWMFAK